MSANIPLVSVVMTAYNAEKYIEESIKSILNQTFTDFEFLIYNDGSTDQTQAVIEGFKDPRIKSTNLGKNRGVVYCANLGLKESKGKYIARMDADDISKNYRFQKQVDFLEANPNVGLLGGFLIIHGTDDVVIKPTSNDDIKWWFFRGCPVAQPAVMIRKVVLEKNKLQYDPAFKSAEDLELWFQMAKHTNIANLPEVLLEYRVHGEQESTANIDRQNAYRQKSLVSFFSYLGVSITPENILFAEHLFLDLLPYTSENLLKGNNFFNALQTKNCFRFFGKRQLDEKKYYILKRFLKNLSSYTPLLIFKIPPSVLWNALSQNKKAILLFYIKCLLAWKTRIIKTYH